VMCTDGVTLMVTDLHWKWWSEQGCPNLCYIILVVLYLYSYMEHEALYSEISKSIYSRKTIVGRIISKFWAD
jgi:hypothetical protein